MADKRSISQILNRRPDSWFSPAEIKEEAGGTPDRTLRRRLGELVLEGLVERSGNRKGTRYRWRGASTSGATLPDADKAASGAAGATDTASIFSPANEQLLQRIAAPIYTRPPVTYSETWLESYVPNRSAYLSSAQTAELKALGKRAPIYGRAGTYIQTVYNRLLIDLSYNSARLEGNTYTLADTEHLVIDGVAAPGKPNAERIMILNHKEAIRYLVQTAGPPVADEETIRTLHYLLADSLVAPGAAGQIRTESIAVGGTTYAPLEGRERLSRLLRALLDKARLIEDPFEQSFFLLGHISYLQAFVDVNKRTARLASIIPLIANDYVPQSFVDVDKSTYLKATLVFYEFNEVGPLADLYCWSYRRSCQHFDTSVQVLGFDEIAALYRPQRRAMVAELVRGMVPPEKALAYIDTHLPPQIEVQHQGKFRQDVLAELAHLDAARMGGLGITRTQLEGWLRLRADSQN
jgi:hypothetical protein